MVHKIPENLTINSRNSAVWLARIPVSSHGAGGRAFARKRQQSEGALGAEGSGLQKSVVGILFSLPAVILFWPNSKLLSHSM